MILFFHATLWNSKKEPETSIIIDAMDEKQAKKRIEFLNNRTPEGSKWNYDGPFPIDRTIVIDEVLAYEIANTWWIALMFTSGMKNWAAELIAKRSQRKWFKYIKFKGLDKYNPETDSIGFPYPGKDSLKVVK